MANFPWTTPTRSLLVLALALLASVGCREPGPSSPAITPNAGQRIGQENSAGQDSDEQPAPQAETPVSLTPLVEPSDGGQLTEEAWDAYSIQGSRVGYAHTTVASVEEGGRSLVRTRNASRTVMKRAGQTITQDMLLTSWETPAGELVRFETRMTTGPGQIVAVGQVAAGKLQITVSTLGKAEIQTIPWQAEWGGFFVAEQSLKAKPLQPGEKRTVRGLLPLFNLVAENQLTAVDYELVKLPAGETKLLRVDSTIDIRGQKLDTTFWVNERGDALKSLVPAIQQEAVRTTREDALQSGGGAFDLLVASTVKLKGELPKPLTTKRVVYRAHVSSGKIEGVFANCLSQRVKLIDDQTAEITVLAIRPDEPAKLDLPVPQPTTEDLDPNSLIQSDDELIRQIAAKVPVDGSSWKTTLAFEKLVAESIKKKNFSQAFATASEVARSLEGDCTEHAVLLAALLRAKSIPARAALGLVYYPPQQGFAYHMWTEAWTGDRWVPIDGTLGLGGIGADHIKLADSSLKGSSAYAAMLPVVQVFGRLELKVLEVEH